MKHGLNAPQQQAVECIDQPCFVLAGAGSGKTRVITHKILHLLKQGFQAKQIAAITFTNKAAQEMQERLKHMLSQEENGLKQLKQLRICTFHALGLQILRKEHAHLQLKKNFCIFDSDDCLGVLQDLTQVTDKAVLQGVQGCISRWKNKLISPDNCHQHIESELEQTAAQVYLSYIDTMRAYSAVDFDDLILLPYQLFNREHGVLMHWQQQLRYILIDEYQDTNLLQYALFKTLVGHPSQRQSLFTLVGDDDQSIYGWRGADIENLKRVTEDYPQLNIIKLEQNYRSTPTILKAANHLIAHNPKLFDKQLWSGLVDGSPIEVYAVSDDDHEAESLLFRLNVHRIAYETNWSDYAILYRNNYQSKLIEKVFRRENIPYIVNGSQSFFDKAEVKDIFAYLRLIVNPDDDPAFIRAASTPKKGIGGQTLASIGQLATQMHASLYETSFMNMLQSQLSTASYASLSEFVQFIDHMQSQLKHLSVNQLLQELLEYMNYEAYLYDQFDANSAHHKWQSVLEFIEWLKKRGTKEDDDTQFDNMDFGSMQKDLAQLVQTIHVINLLDRQTTQNNAIQLATLHAAKGLEFDHVFLIGLEEGLLPFAQEDRTSPIEEERRLMYVGITRARKSLQITWCKQRKRGGEKNTTQPSRFLLEMQVMQALNTQEAVFNQQAQDSLKLIEQTKLLMMHHGKND